VNTCSNRTDVRDEAQQWPGVQCGSAEVAPNLDDIIMDGMRNEGTILFNPGSRDRHMALLLNTVQQPSTLRRGADDTSPQLMFVGAVLACLNISNRGGLRASDMIKFSVQNLTNHDGASVAASGNVVVNGVTNEVGAGIDVTWGRLSIANAVNAGKINATVVSAFLADVENLAEASILLRAEDGPSVSSGEVFALETITNHGIVNVTTGMSRILTGCGVANSAGATIAVLGSSIGAMHILENAGTLDFTGSTGTVTMVGSASMGTVTGDEGITWVLNGQDCAVTPPPTPAPHGYTYPPTTYQTYLDDLASSEQRWLSENQVGYNPDWYQRETSLTTLRSQEAFEIWLRYATPEELAAYYEQEALLELQAMHSCEPANGCYILPRGTGESRTTAASKGPSLTVTFADGHFSKLIFAGGEEAISQVTRAVVMIGNGSVALRDIKAFSIRPGSNARTSTLVQIDFKSNVLYSLATSIAAAIGATPTKVMLTANHTTDGSTITMVSTSASADEAESEDGESSSGSSSGSFVGILIVAIAVTVLAAVVRRQSQKPKTARRSAKVSPSSMDGMIMTSRNKFAALDEAKAAASSKRATVQVTAIAAAALTGSGDTPAAGDRSIQVRRRSLTGSRNMFYDSAA